MDFENVNVNVNFIFLHKNDGTGMFEEGNPEHDSLVEALATKVNEVYNTLHNYDEPGCFIPPDEFLSESKIQIIPNYIYIDDEYGWNNENDEYPYCPYPPWYLDYLDEQIANDPNIEKGINVYFTETGWYYEDLVVNQTTEEMGPIQHACSQPPTKYDLDRSSRVHMPNVFTKYWWMKHIGPEIYDEPWYNTIRGWFINSVGELIAHELGHSFGLGHVDDCEYNIMHTEPIFRDTYTPNQIGEMHRSLSITNVRQFSTEGSYITSPYEISSDKLWDLDHTRYQDVIVEEGATLTITCKLVMKNNAKIIVEQGGHLIVDGGIITTEDDSLWKGIEVWGNADSSQYCISEPCPQGKLEIINGGTIENAEIGVDLWHPDHWNSTGGIVQAEDAVFRNNAKSVHASHYHNYFPTNPGKEADNLSRFTNCTFEITDDYFGTKTFYKHVDLADVRGIDFEGCDFSVDDQVNGVSTWNSGIAAYDAVFDVEAA